MTTQKIAIIAGDGIGPEVTAQATQLLDQCVRQFKLPLSLVEFDYGAERFLRDGVTLPPEAVQTFRQEYAAILVGALGDSRVPDNRHARDILLGLRSQLDLYINLRPIKLYDERLCPLKNKRESHIDMMCFRENTEGLYVGMGGCFKRGTPDEIAINEDVNSRKGVERILRAAFEYAKQHKKRLCMSDKSNAMEYAHGLWRRVFAELRSEYSTVEAEHLYIDVLAMQMVRQPERFDVIVTCNLFGDIITDLGAALVGGLGMAASANLNPGKVSLFEPVHGSAPDIVGRGIANPMGAIVSAAMLLEHLGHGAVAERIHAAVRQCIVNNDTTPDLGGSCSSAQVGAKICALVQA